MEEYITITNTLIMSLMVILVFILYQRMLYFLGKRNTRLELYATFLGDEFQMDGTVMTIRVEVPETTEYNLRLFGPGDQLMAELGYGVLEPGVKEFLLETAIYAPGKYYMQLNTGNHRATRFFTIEPQSHSFRHIDA